MKHSNGFTLVEGVMTLLVISAGTLMLLTLLGNNQSHFQNGKKRGGALSLSSNLAEAVRHKSKSQGLNNLTYGADTVILNDTEYSRQWSVKDTLLPDAKQLDITVTWGQNQSINQTLYLTPMTTSLDATLPPHEPP